MKLKISIITVILYASLNTCCMRIIILHDPLTAEEHNDLGVAYWNENHLAAAEREFKKAIAKDKYYWLAYYNLGTILLDTNTKKSKEYLHKAIIYNPEFADAYNNLAIAELKSKNTQKAFYLIQLALKYCKNDKHKYIDTLASYYEQISDMKESCKYFMQAIQQAPEKEKSKYENKYVEKCSNLNIKD